MTTPSDPLDWRSRARILGSVPLIDVALTALFTLDSCASLTFLVDYGFYTVYGLNVALTFALALAVLFRRTHVRASFLATVLLLIAYAALHFASPVNLGIDPIILTAPLSLWAITRWDHSRNWGIAGVLIGMVGSLVNPMVLFKLSAAATTARVLFFGLPASVLMAAVYAIALKQRSNAEAHAFEIADVAQQERLSLSRELHDVVGHGLTAISIRARTGLMVGSPEDALRDIDAAAQKSLADVRELVDALRDSSNAPPLALARLRAMSEAAGVRFDADESFDDWPLHVRLVLNRVITEMITNVQKYGDHGALTVGAEDEGAVVKCVNAVARTSPRPGHGLEGMRERLEALGGTLDVSKSPTEFTVTARCPL